MPSRLVTRQYYNVCYDSAGNPYRCNSAWYDWGRWVALGVIILGAFLIFFLFSLISARRRRRAGRQPMYGTGWTGRTPWGHAPAAPYNPGYQNTQQAPPAYNQTQNYGGYYGENQGYFGGRQTGRDVEMQPPQNVYPNTEFTPPSGPPPAKV